MPHLVVRGRPIRERRCLLEIGGTLAPLQHRQVHANGQGLAAERRLVCGTEGRGGLVEAGTRDDRGIEAVVRLRLRDAELRRRVVELILLHRARVLERLRDRDVRVGVHHGNRIRGHDGEGSIGGIRDDAPQCGLRAIAIELRVVHGRACPQQGELAFQEVVLADLADLVATLC